MLDARSLARVRLFHFRPLSLSRARVLSFFLSCSRSLARSLALFLSRLFARSVAFSLSGVGGGTNGRRRRQTAAGTRRHRSDPFLFPSFSGYIPFRTLSKVVCDQFVVSCWAGETSLILIQYVAASDTSTHTRPVCRSLTHTHVHARTHARTHTHAHTLSLTLSHKPLQARQADRRNVNRYRLLAIWLRSKRLLCLRLALKRCVCMHVCMHMCMHACRCAKIYVCMAWPYSSRACVYVCIYVCMSLHTSCVCMYVCMNACMNVCLHVEMYMYVCA